MPVKLDRMLSAVQNGQWSVDDFDWSTPLQGAEGLSPRARTEAAYSLLFTAGLERQAAAIFDLAAEFADDEQARQIYKLFAKDERRHAEAETRLAARYGVAPEDLPLPIRWSLKTLAKNFRAPNRGLHELSSAIIVLFELALDTMLLPALKEQVDDPLQSKVFRLIDLDETRHLAMDYWLLDQKAKLYDGRTFREVVEAESGPKSLLDRATGRYKMIRSMVALLVAFGSTSLLMPNMRKAIDEQKLAKYLARVDDIPRKARGALSVPTFRMGMKGQRLIVDLVMRLDGRARSTSRLARAQ